VSTAGTAQRLPILAKGPPVVLVLGAVLTVVMLAFFGWYGVAARRGRSELVDAAATHGWHVEHDGRTVTGQLGSWTWECGAYTAYRFGDPTTVHELRARVDGAFPETEILPVLGIGHVVGDRIGWRASSQARVVGLERWKVFSDDLTWGGALATRLAPALVAAGPELVVIVRPDGQLVLRPAGLLPKTSAWTSDRLRRALPVLGQLLDTLSGAPGDAPA
jgi:hypothetical protein